jgi:hypothetical protein
LAFASGNPCFPSVKAVGKQLPMIFYPAWLIGAIGWKPFGSSSWKHGNDQYSARAIENAKKFSAEKR